MSNQGPQRTCLGCNGRDEQSGLIRLRVTEQGDLQIDPSTRAPALAGGSGSGFRPTGVVEGATRLPGGGQAGLPVGLHKKGAGRGGYLHQRAECWQGFLKRKSLYRAFHVEIDKGVKEKLVRELAKC